MAMSDACLVSTDDRGHPPRWASGQRRQEDLVLRPAAIGCGQIGKYEGIDGCLGVHSSRGDDAYAAVSALMSTAPILNGQRLSGHPPATHPLYLDRTQAAKLSNCSVASSSRST